jgi:CYTH domain-containing protein
VITKKNLVNENDASTQIEQNIKITKEEFLVLSNIPASKIRKIRYNYNGAEIDIFKDKFKGLVLVDVEFTSKENLTSFKMPDFCLVEITGDTNFAGGVLCKQKISNLKKILKTYRYKNI